ncbi:hypothetical protein VP01_3861g2 [Puccinia sorghi]|uniref:Uncharacterized protein n=1 Tax=Puccinia sorghi TaxID=27349 RepID=A0A0L6UT54_9BASI|nr:hypothetical protein VP01_3861g2 [Puccinia sorghi]
MSSLLSGNAEDCLGKNPTTNQGKIFDLMGKDYCSPKAPGGTQSTGKYFCTPLGETIDAILNRDSAQKLWLSINERFASSQSSNRAHIFNDFLYVRFQEDALT